MKGYLCAPYLPNSPEKRQSTVSKVDLPLRRNRPAECSLLLSNMNKSPAQVRYRLQTAFINSLVSVPHNTLSKCS